MALKAKKAEVIKEGKPKFLISGKPGVGKTFFALDFPSLYFIDTEGGATRKQYRDKLIKNGSMYMGTDEGSQDFREVINEIKLLTTTQHNFKTLVIDSFSKLYNLEAAIAEEKIGNDFGRDRKEANRPSRQLLRWISVIDMNVILICHYKDKWERKSGDMAYAGSSFDGYDKIEYDLDLWIEAFEQNNRRFFTVKKTRIDAFKLGATHPLSYQDFADLYGKEAVESPAKPASMASPEQAERLAALTKALNTPAEVIEKWMTKANVEKFSEMTADQVQKCIDMLEKELKSLQGVSK